MRPLKNSKLLDYMIRCLDKFFKPINSIRTKIFLAYGSIFLLLIILGTLLYYFTSYHNFLDNQANTSKQLSKILSSQVTQYIDSLNSIQKRILESEDILEYVFETAPLRNAIDEREFRNNIYTITGYDFDFYHMNILNLNDNTLLTFGQEYYYEPYTITSDTLSGILEPTLNLNGAKNIIATDRGSLYTPDRNTHTLSLCRGFSHYLLSPPKAIIEIQINYERIEEIISNNLVSYGALENNVLIFNNQKQLIYPLEFSEEALRYYTSLDTKKESLFHNPNTKETEIVTSYYSQSTGLTTLLITPESYIIKNKWLFRNTGLIFCLISFCLLIFITYKVAQSITAPLAALKKRISSLELAEISEKPLTSIKDGSYNELEILNEAYNRMQRRLKESLDDIVASRTLTIHSQIMALQAQMDSHFLYNTLTIISIIAEENGDMPASVMCIKLTEMLRYITEDYSKVAAIEQEIHHTMNYTDLMSIRYGDKINFKYNTDSSLELIQIPRLMIQPIVENCVKYSRNTQRILKIDIQTYTKDGYWYINIKDNGDGFTKQALANIQDKISSLNTEKNYPQLSIDGLGLANIYLRLKLYYTKHFVFELKNLEVNGTIIGASITIGGVLQ